MRKIFSIDRIEGNLAVCISDDEEQIVIPTNALSSFSVHDVFSAEVNGKKLENIIPMPEERDRRIAANKERIRKIIEKNRK